MYRESIRIVASMIVGCLIGIGGSPADAEPSSPINWLMNQPVSLFDLGILRLRLDMEYRYMPELRGKIKHLNLRAPKSEGNSSAVYNFDDNTITLSASLIGEPTERTCSAVLDMLRDIFHYKAEPTDLGLSLIAVPFHRINYSEHGRPEKVDAEIANMIRLTVGISSREVLGEGRSLSCTRGLWEAAPSYKKFGFD